jgi:N-acetylglucosamine kinase-like BadF-type ATPase
MKDELLISIDGGGTKTLGVLYDLQGHELNRLTSNFANFSVDISATKKNIEHTIDYFYKCLKSNQKIVFIQIGVAGFSTLKDAHLYLNYLEAKYQTNIHLTTDAHLALYAVKKNKNVNVIMVLGGTGSVVMANDLDQVFMIGGHGHILGDEGSAYHLSLSALKNMIKSYEQSLELSSLSKYILEYLNLEHPLDLKHYVYNHTKSDLAKLSLLISKFAIEGHEEAINLFKTEGYLLSEQVLRAYQKMHHKEKLIIALRGKFLLDAPYVKETLLIKLKNEIKDFDIDLFESDTVIGGYYLGLENLSRRNKP